MPQTLYEFSLLPCIRLMLFIFQPAKVTAHWHKGTTLMIKFKDLVLSRERTLDGR